MIVLKEAECCAPDAARTVVQHPCAGDRVRPQLKRDPLGGCGTISCTAPHSLDPASDDTRYRHCDSRADCRRSQPTPSRRPPHSEATTPTDGGVGLSLWGYWSRATERTPSLRRGRSASPSGRSRGDTDSPGHVTAQRDVAGPTCRGCFSPPGAKLR